MGISGISIWQLLIVLAIVVMLFGTKRLKTLGMTFGQPAPIDVGHVKSIYGRDPEGNLIEIQQTAENCDFPLDDLPPVPR